MLIRLSVAPCGFGKSITIAQQAAVLTYQGASVLLATPTHAVADEAKMRLASLGVEYYQKQGVQAACTNVRQHIAMATGGFDRSICEVCTEWRKCGYTKVLTLTPKKGAVAITTHAGAVWGNAKDFDFVIYDEQPPLVMSTIDGKAPENSRFIWGEHFCPIYPTGTEGTEIYTATPNQYEILLLFGKAPTINKLARTFPHGLHQQVEYVPLKLPMRGDWYAGVCTTKSRTAKGQPYYGSIGVNTYRGGTFSWVGSYRYPPQVGVLLSQILTGLTGEKHFPFRVPYTIDFLVEGQEFAIPSGGWGIAKESDQGLVIITDYVEPSLRDVVQSLGRAGSRESIEGFRGVVRVKYVSDVPLNLTVHPPDGMYLLTPELRLTKQPVPIRWAAEVVLSPNVSKYNLNQTLASAIARHWAAAHPLTPPKAENPSALQDFYRLVSSSQWLAADDALARQARKATLDMYRRV